MAFGFSKMLKWPQLICIIYHAMLFQPYGKVDGVITDESQACNKIFTGSGGQILSPDFPEEYPDNLACTWVIKVDVNSRIKIVFEEFKLEAAAECFDKLLVNDGIQQDSPSLGRFCGSDGKGVSLTSSGNTMFLQFITDESLGDKGIKLFWEAIPKIDLNNPSGKSYSDPWKGMAAPKNIIDFDSGLADGSIWAIDSNYDIFYFNGEKWDVQGGKLKSISVGQSGIFGINPTNNSIYWRNGASFSNPEGDRWQLISRNTKKIQKIESGGSGFIYGLDSDNVLYYSHVRDRNRLDENWRRMSIDLEEGGTMQGSINDISCGFHGCWVTMKSGFIYGMDTPWNPAQAKWTSDFGNYIKISSGFGDNVWALNSNGDVFKKKSVGSLRPMGAEWNKQIGISLSEISAGFTGVFGLTRDSDFVFHKDAVCGGVLENPVGTVQSANYPSKYPSSQSCLWIIKPPNSNTIDLNFKSPFEVKHIPLCGDYIITSYPGIKEPIVECGKKVLDKKITADEVWIEFVSNDEDEGVGFGLDYVSYQQSTTPNPQVSTSTTPIPANWFIVVPQQYFGNDVVIKSLMPSYKSIMWMLSSDGRVFVKNQGSTSEVKGKVIKSLAVNHNVVWALDKNNNLLVRKEVTVDNPKGSYWEEVQRNTPYIEIFSGPNGMFLVRDSVGVLRYCIVTKSGTTECKPSTLPKDVVSISSNNQGFWVIDKNGQTSFVRVKKQRNSQDFTFKIEPLATFLKDIATTSVGDVWGLLPNGSLVYRKGVSALNPTGLSLQWVVYGIEGDEIHNGYDTIFVKNKDGNVITQRDPGNTQTIPEDWSKITTSIERPYKIDAYPDGYRMEVWVLAGDNGNRPYVGYYDGADNIDFQSGGDVQLTDLSIGESGVWAIDNDGHARYYDNTTKDWMLVPNDDYVWKSVESSSPYRTVYAVSYATNELFFRDGITPSNVLGNEWVATGIKVLQISSGSFITYAVMDDSQLRSFSSPPTKSNLKSWVSSWKITDKAIENKLSMGFDGSLVYLDDDNYLLQRKSLTLKHEEDDTKWVWTSNRIPLTDVSAGPVIFGVSGTDVVVKPVTSCYGFFNKITEKTHVQIRPGELHTHCTWLLSAVKAASMEVEFDDSTIPSSPECIEGGLFYSSNHQTPLLGSFSQYCGNSPYEKQINGDRVFYQFYRNNPLSTDEIQLEIIPKQTEVAGCGGSITDSSGTIASQNYPLNYNNNEDCVWTITVDGGKRIELTIDDLDIEFGSSTCDYDFLRITDGDSKEDKQLGLYCSKEENVILKSSGNSIRLHFKSDSSGVAKGFRVKWKDFDVSSVGSTTRKPGVTTPFSGNTQTIPEDWSKITTSIERPYKIDAYPDGYRMEVWVLAGDNGNQPYVGYYDGADNIDFQSGGDVQLTDLSIGESGVWAIDNDGHARYYDNTTKDWMLVPNDDYVWKSVESSSPYRTVYAVSYATNELFFRDGITPGNVLGNEWVATGIKVLQISSGSFITYAVMDKGQLRSFNSPPTKSNLKSWVSSWKITYKTIEKKLSMGFDGSLVYLDNDNYLLQRKSLTLKHEEDDTKWVWTLNRIRLTDVSAGPVIFGVSGTDVVVKPVTSCYGFFNKITEKTYVQIRPGALHTHCTWLLSAVKAASMEVEFDDSTIPSSPECIEGGLFYSSNHQTPLLGSFSQYCGNSPYEKQINGDRVFYQFYRNNPLSTDEIELEIIPKQTEIAGCGGSITDSSGTIASQNYPLNYNNNEDCVWTITVDGGKRIELTIDDLDIEFGSSTCDYDFLRITDGDSKKDKQLGLYCSKEDNVMLKSSGNSIRLHFKSDSSGVAKGFRAKWKDFDVSSVGSTTRKPGVTTPFSGNTQTIPEDWSKITTSIERPYKIDAYPDGYRMEVWVLAGDNGNQPYVGYYDGADNIDFQSGGDVQLTDLSIGESGVWAIDNDGHARYYDNTTKDWMLVPNDDYVWKSVESSSPYRTVYAVSYATNELFFRDGITPGNVLGNEWVATGIKVLQISSGSFITYAVMDKGQLRSFNSPPTKSNLKSWVSSWKITYKTIEKKLSMGFDGSLVYLDNDNYLLQRKSLTLKHEEDDTKWVWTLNRIRLTDVSAGPVIFGVSGTDVVVKPVTSCYGFFNKITEKTYVQIRPGALHTHCTWLLSAVKAASMEVEFDDSTIPSSPECIEGGLFYSSNHQTPLLGSFSQYCGNSPYEKQINGDRVFYQFYRNNPLSTDEIELEIIPKQTEIAGCGGSITDFSGTITSQNYPLNYNNNEDCVWTITVDGGKRIELTIDDLDIEFGSSTCDYDFLRITDGDSKKDKQLGLYCSKEDNVMLKSSGNSIRLHFKSDSSGVAKGFRAKWKDFDVGSVGSTTRKPGVTTPFSGCGGSLNGNQGSLTSPNWPSNYESSLNCEWYITADPGREIEFRLIDSDIEFSNGCLYDYLEVFDGLRDDAKPLDRFCAVKKDITKKASGNTMRVVFRSDASNNRKGFIAEWKTSEGTGTVTLPDDWKIYIPAKPEIVDSITSNPSGTLWFVNKLNGNIHVIKTEGDSESIGNNQFIQVSLGKNGAWSLTNPDKRVWFLNSTSMKNPENTKWNEVTTPENLINQKIVSTSLNVYLISDIFEIYVREGIDDKNPSGTKWAPFNKGKDVAENAYGVWVLRSNGDLYFKPSGGSQFEKVNSPSSNEKVRNIYTGFGEKLYVLVGDELFKRIGIKFSNKFGTSWESTGLRNVKDVTINNEGTIAVLNTNEIVKLEDQICGGILTKKSGYINYPEFDSGYKEGKQCLWLIHVPGAKQLRIRKIRFDVENSAGCQKDRVSMFSYSSGDNKFELEKVMCGTTDLDGILDIENNKLFIEFISDADINKRGFAFSYISSEDPTAITTTVKTRTKRECGGTFSASSGFIASPNYPQKYENNLFCEYKLRLAKGKTMVLSFLQFKLEESKTCQYDSLKIYEYEENGERVIQKTHCGSNDIDDYVSKGNAVDLVFETDDSSPREGFSIRYIDSSMTPRTTSSPSPYPNGWKEISSPARTFLGLDASVESPVVWATDLTGAPHFYDVKEKKWVNIDKPSTGLKLAAGKFGIFAVDKNNDLFIRFEVNPTNIKGQYWGRLNTEKKLDEIDYGANGEVIGITTENEVVSRLGISPAVPEGTSWKTLTTGFRSVSVGTYGYWLLNDRDEVFFSSYIPSSTVYDKLNVVRINGKFKKVVAGFGGNVWAIDRDNIVYRRMKVNFLNPSGIQWEKIEKDGMNLLLFDISAGYDAVYGITSTGRILRYSESYCGGIYTTKEGSLSSPSFPLFYKPNQNCLYIIKTPGYDQLTLKFPTFDIEESTACSKDYLLPSYDGTFPSNYGVKRKCGVDISPIVFKDRAWIEFFSDDNKERPGFLLEWKAEKVVKTTITTKAVVTTERAITTPADRYHRKCGGSLSGTEGTIVHPNYPNTYQNDRNCNYVITVPPNQKIRVTLEEVDFERSDRCNYDYLELRDSLNNRQRRYCKPEIYEDFISSGRNLVVRFYSDETGKGKGFKLTWKAVPEDSVTSIPRTTVVTTTTTTTQSTKPTTELKATTKQPTHRACGQVFRSYSGYMYHPSYPRPYKNNINCLWTVQAPEKSRIRLEFKFFKLEYSFNCANDYVAVYDGPDDKSSLLTRSCGKDLPDNLESTRNTISVVMKTNGEVTDQGAVILYKRIESTSTPAPTTSSNKKCKHEVTGNSGTITHPNYPSKYSVDVDCFWTINVNKNEKIELKFVEFDLEKSGSCNYDFLRIRDGENVNAPELGNFCGSNIPADITSSGSQLFLRFRSDDRQTRRGFKLTWKSIKGPTEKPTTTIPKSCEEYFTTSSGEIKSPSYPNNYFVNTNCYYRITVPENHRILLTFNDMDIEKGPSCNYDFIRIQDGGDNTSPILGKYCGKVSPNPKMSSGNKLYLYFRSDDRQTRKGFRLSWNSVKEGDVKTTVKTTTEKSDDCVYTLNGFSGTITHPNYPNKYQTNRHCKWSITVANDRIIQLKFVEWDIESSPGCTYDHLDIFDGKTSLDKKIGQYCGKIMPDTQYSSNNDLFIEFYSDDRQVRNGFKVEWKAVSNNNQKCGGVYTKTNSELTHSSFPSNYKDNQDCTYTINAPRGYRIVLYFQRFGLESSTNCGKDYIHISEGTDNEKKTIGKYCGFTPPSIVRSDKGVVTLRFKTDDDVSNYGFKAIYYFLLIQTTTTTPTTTTSTSTATTTTKYTAPATTSKSTPVVGKCEYKIRGNNGQITHLNYPNKYATDQDCIWIVTVPTNKVIELSFEEFELEYNSRCTYDFLEIYDGDDRLDKKLGRYCGNVLPGKKVSSDNNVLIRFYSDDRQTRKGFKILWRAVDKSIEVCGGVYTTTQGTFTHASYPNDYKPNQDCTYTLNAPRGYRIVLYFQRFGLESSTSCRKDYIHISEGADNEKKTIGKYCGFTPPSTVRSEKGVVTLRFKTDDDASNYGFKATYYFELIQDVKTTTTTTTTERSTKSTEKTKVETGSPIYRSSQHFSMDSGQFAHPGYPANYKNNMDSTWLITAAPGKAITLRFKAFDIQRSSNCQNDYVEVYDGDKKSGALIGKYCNIKPGTIRSTGNKITIIFHSDDNVVNTGFTAAWTTLDTTIPEFDICDTSALDFDGSSIKISSPGFKSNQKYPSNNYCVLQLSTVPNTIFKITVLNLDLPSRDVNTNKCTDSVRIMDGEETTSREIATLCGKRVAENTLYTTGNRIYIDFKSNEEREEPGFQFEISTIKKKNDEDENYTQSNQCGGRIYGGSGKILSPKTVATTADTFSCAWIIETKPSSKIQISFSQLDLPGDCDIAHIIVRDGEHSDSPVIGRYCGFHTDVSFFTKSNKVWVEYKTPKKNVGRFNLYWFEVSNTDAFDCGGTISGEKGQLTIPKSDSSNHNIFCLWNIMVPRYRKILLKIENMELGDSCDSNYVVVRDGMTSEAKRLGKFCTERSGMVITSNSNAMWVEVRSSCFKSRSFRASWTAVGLGEFPDENEVKRNKAPGIVDGNGEPVSGTKIVDASIKIPTTLAATRTKQTLQPTGNITKVEDAFIITGRSGMIQSPLFPNNYPHDRTKIWILRGPRSGKIRIQFTHFDLEHVAGCMYDFVEVRDGEDAKSGSVGRFCGKTLPATFESSGNGLWVKFRSDASSQETGFMAKWTWVESNQEDGDNTSVTDGDGGDSGVTDGDGGDSVCGGVFTEKTGEIHSPSYPSIYPVNMDCVYVIKPPKAKKIQLEFISFDMEADPNCSYDYVMIRSGSTGSGEKLGRRCNSILPEPYITDRGAFWIRFKSDSTTSRTGFSATWKVLDTVS